MGGVLTKTVLTSVLIFGCTCGVSAEVVHDGDVLNGGTNISVAKDDATNTITISAEGVATSTELDAVKTDVQQNQADIAANTGNIADNRTEIANNKTEISKNSHEIQQNKTDIAANKNAITTNTAKINSNTSDITELKNVNAALGLDKTKPGMKYFRANSSGEDAAATGQDAVAIGVSAKANGKDSVAVGDAARSSSSAENSIAIGRKAVSGSFSGMTADGDSSTVVIGGGKSSVSIGDAANARGNSSIALGDGATVYNDGANVQLNSNSMAIGTQASTVASNNAIALGNKAAVTKNSNSAVAIGDNAKAGAEDALALGKGAAASGADSMAAGTGAAASGSNALALGTAAQAGGTDAVAIGNGAVAGSSASVVLGKDASANAVRSVVLGPNAGVGMVGDVLGAKGSHVVIGDGAGNNVDGQQNIAIGYKTGNNVSSDHNVAIGSEAGTNIGSGGNTSEGKNVSIGYHANKNDAAVSRIQSTALGSETKAADDAVAVGYQAQADGNGSTAVGFNARAVDAASVALGQGAQASGGNIAIGNDSVANASMISGAGYLTGQAAPKTAVSVGNVSTLRRITNVADGAQDQDAVTVAQLKKSIDATVAQVNANVSSATASGVYYDTVTSGDGDSITLRNNDNKGTKIHNVAAGTLGTDAANVAQVYEITDTAKTHYYSVKSTNLNTGDGKNLSTKVENGTLKVVLNDDLNVNSVTTVDADGNKTVTQGSGTTMTDKDGNQTTVNAGGITITPKNPAAGTSAVSLTEKGLDNGGNQIHNVAAGTAGTDAVNVSQLKDEIAKNATKLVDGKNTTVTGTGTADDPYKVHVNDNLNLGEKGENGIDGSIGVAGKDGSAVTINGKDGSIGMNGKDGKDGLTMKSAKGQDGVDGTNGANGMTRIVYEDDAHVTHEVATLDDGLKFAGNTGSVAKKLNSTMTIKGTGTKADTEYDASNIKTVVDANGDLVIGLDKNLQADTVTVGGQGKDGANGVNGAIGVKGADGKDGVTISSVGKDGTNGTDGHIGINGKDGASADIHVVKGVNGVDGTDGYNGTDGIDRIVYEDHNGNTQTVATMNDGMKYGGDVGNVINKKLNEQVNVVGGITDSSRLSTEDNIGVVSDGSDNLKVRLSKDLKGLDTVTTKTVTADTGNITTVNATTVNVGDTTITTGGMTIQNGSAGQEVTLNKDGLNNGGTPVSFLCRLHCYEKEWRSLDYRNQGRRKPWGKQEYRSANWQ